MGGLMIHQIYLIEPLQKLNSLELFVGTEIDFLVWRLWVIGVLINTLQIDIELLNKAKVIEIINRV